MGQPQIRDGRRDDPVRVIAVAVAVGLIGLMVGATLSIAVGSLLATLGVELGITLLIVLSIVLTQGVAFGGVALGYLRFRGLGRDFIPVDVPSLRDILWVVSGYVLAFVAVSVGAIIVIVSGAPSAPNRVSEIGIETPEILLVLIPLSILLIGPGEELLFRGVVQGTIREAFGPVAAIGIASAIFAAVHFVALSGGVGARVVTIGVLFLPSLVFGTAYELTRNLVVPSLIHGLYNATLFTLLYATVRFGGEVGPTLL